MNTVLKNFQITTLGACLTIALAAGVVSTTANADSSEVRGSQASKVSLKQAINIASKEASGTLIGAGFDDVDDDDKAQGRVYEIEFSTASRNYEIKIDANTGHVISTETERLESGDVAEYKALTQAKISSVDAMHIAEKKSGGRVVDVEFKHKSDASPTAYYEVEVLKDHHIHELIIDTNTGKILKNTVKK